MTVYDVVAQLTHSGLKLRVNNGSLNVSAPKGAMTPMLAKLIGDNKDKLVELFEGIQEKGSIPPAAEKDYYALSSAQRRMYFLQDFDRSSVAYNIPEVVRLKGVVDEHRLEVTFRKLIARHESLRTSFGVVNEAVVQWVAPVVDFALSRYTAREEEIPDVVSAFVRPFDLRQAPLLRVGLITLPADQGMGQAILLVDMHHIICDGVSHSILVRDFMSLYHGSMPDGLTIQYKDYAEWQQSTCQQSLLEKHRAFWLKQYEEEPTPLTLPYDFARPQHRGYAGEVVHFSIDGAERNRLQAIAQAEGATLYMIILAAYNVLLAKVCNEYDIIVGTPTAGRQHPDLDGVIGMFVNTLCLRNSPRGTWSFKQFLRSVRENTLDCIDHQDYQYEALIDDLKLARDASRNPLFDVMFSYQNMEEQQVEIAGLTLAPVEHVQPKSKFDLTLRAGAVGERLHFTFEYATELFRESTIRRFVDYFKKIIHTITADPAVLLRDIDILSNAERERLLLTFNDTRRDFPGDTTVVALFEEQAVRTPHATALAQGGRQMCYEELNERANEVAHVLAGRGVGAGSVVGLMIDRSMEMVVGILGILKTGAVYLPLNGDQPEGRTLQVIRDSGASLLLTESAYSDSFRLHIDVVDIRDEALQSLNKRNLEVTVLPTSPAYILYTSGSTGTPKGVLIGHRSVVNMVHSQRERYAIDEADTILLFSAVTFDASVQQMWLALLSGARLVTVDKEVLLNHQDFTRYLIDQKITHLHITPSFLDAIDLQGCSHLKRVVLGGEAFRVNARHLHAGNFEFYNSYGPTENTVTSVSCKITAQAIRACRFPIGRPVDNVQAYVLGRWGELLPEGAIGELYLGGEGLAKGYLNDPILTREKFVSNPFIAGTTLYKTGDFVRWLPDGALEFVGRTDDQVKIRGYRIELGEISYVLGRYDGVREALVLTKSNASDTYLVAYYTSEKAIYATVLRDYLLGELPDYMVPGYYVWLEKIPLTAHGKLDKRALPDPVMLADDGYVAAGNALEEQLVALWSEVLTLDNGKISVTKSFFELGGHSLKAIFLINKIRKQLRVEVPLKDFFRHQSIAKLALFIQGLSVVPDTGATKADMKYYYALSSAQSRMYFLHVFDKQSLAYNMPYVIRAVGDIDKGRIEDTFNRLISRHESLRTSFVEVDDAVFQKIHDTVSLSVEYFESDRDSAEFLVGTFVRPFDLTRAPLVRVGLIQVDALEHILMLDMHHIITDGVSQGIVMQDFMRLYRDEPLPALEFQYKDYSEWQRGRDQQEDMQRQRFFWHGEFEEEVTVLNLPTDFERPAEKKHDGGFVNFVLGVEDTAALKLISEQAGATLFMTLLSVYYVLLARLSNQEDIVIGTPVAGRQHADFEGIIGLFVNTLPLRNYPRGDIQFMDFLQQVTSVTLMCFEHQAYPYERLIDELRLARDTNRNPLFDVLFSYQNIAEQPFGIAGLELTPFGEARPKSKFDLTLRAAEGERGLDLTFEYAAALFERSTIERFAAYFCSIVRAIAADPEVLLRDIDVLSTEERKRLLVTFNDTKRDFPGETTVIDLFEKQSARTPHAIALGQGDRQMSYQKLNESANQVAHFLACRGVGVGSVVGLMIGRSMEMVVGTLGILKTGAAYLPLNGDQPEGRTLQLIQDSGASLLLTEAAYVDSFGTHMEVVDIRDGAVQSFSRSNPGTVVLPASLAYILYTSGSTGNPKGVLIGHRSVVNMVYSQRARYAIDEADNVLLFSAVTFDASVQQMWLALLSGAKLVTVDKDVLLNHQDFSRYLVQQNITHLHVTPSFLDVLDLQDCMQLKRVVLGGEVFRIHARHQGVGIFEFYNSYGPTENTVTSVSCKISGQAISMGRFPIGTPVDNVQAYVLGRCGELLPEGTIGELYLSGEGLAKGYLNDPVLTREKFVRNPFMPGAMMYRTGDFVRWLPDGQLEFVGRIDDQVKIRGYRIELKEISNVLRRCEGIREALVLAKEHSPDKYLVAYYTSEKAIHATVLRDYLLGELPEYMVPGYYVWLEKMPLTAHGKLDKRALPDVVVLSDDDYVAPGDALEAHLVSLWADVLALDGGQVSVTKNFFELGGHSLKAAFLINRIRKELHVDVPLKDFFRHQNITKLALFIRGLSAGVGMAIEKAAVKDYYALSSAQSRMYFLQAFDTRSLAYNMPYVVKINGDLDRERIADTFRRLVSRHESLRTSFVNIHNAIFQKIHDTAVLPLEYFESDRYAAKAIMDSFVRPFDLGQVPLVRVGLIRVGASEHILMVDMHHIITDGVSQGILVQDFMRLYRDEPLPALEFHYKDYSEWQQSRYQREAAHRQRSFWHGEFEGEVPVLNLPTDFKRPAEKKYDGDRVSFSLDGEEMGMLRSLSEQAGATMYMTLLSVYYVLLSKVSNQEDIVVGTPVAGRLHSDFEGIIGMFVNTLPLRNYPQAGLGFIDFLQQVKSVTLDCFEHQAYQYERLIDELRIERDTSRNPLFDVTFSYQYVDGGALSIPGWQLSTVDRGRSLSKFDLSLAVSERAEEVSFSISYSTALFKPDTIQRFIYYFKRIVSCVIRDVHVTLRDIDVISPAEKALLLSGFNNTAFENVVGDSVVRLFEAQVAADPKRIALVFNGSTITYGALNERSDSLAHFLSGKGVGAGDIVCILANQSFEMFFGMMGVLKSGAAYLPIDSHYPKDRIEYILNDSGCRALLSLDTLMEGLDLRRDYIDLRDPILYAAPHQRRSFDVAPTGLAYVIYTSGSTGRPKGVMVEHRALLNLCAWYTGYYAVTAGDITTKYAAFGFDASVMEIFPFLIKGACIHIIAEPLRLDMQALNDYFNENGVTISFLPTQVCEHFMHLDNSSLRVLLTGGDKLNNVRTTRYTVVNNYGPTENTVVATAFALNEEVKQVIPIGRPIYNNRAYILGGDDRLLPLGVVGQLCIGGMSLARGYLNDDALTHARFVENPFRPGERMYTTGDLARWRPDGNLEFMGRLDEQVKIRGFRIEPGEIEHHLNGCDRVNESVVLAREISGDKYLVAYYTADGEVDVVRLRQYLLGKVPGYMVPAYFARLEQIPLTQNGKVNKAALPLPVVDRLSDHEMPSTAMEEMLVRIWAEILKLEAVQISVTANFFDMGGHSLKAIQVVTAVLRELKSVLTLRDIFNNPTIRGISQVITDQRRERSLLVKLNEVGAGSEDVFFIPPVIGSSTVFRDVAVRLNQRYSVYGIQYTGFDSEDVVDGSIEAMAETFVDEVRRTAKSSTISLIGYSMGVPIAFEMAKILEREGYRLKLVFIDRGVSGQSMLGKWSDVQLSQFLEAEVARWTNTVKELDSDRISDIIRHNYRVLNRYQVSGVIISDIFAIEALRNHTRANMSAWKECSRGDFRHVFMDEDHYGMLEATNAIALAEFIAMGLARAVDENS